MYSGVTKMKPSNSAIFAAHALVETLGRFADECQQDVAGYTLDGEWYYVGRVMEADADAEAEATA